MNVSRALKELLLLWASLLLLGGLAFFALRSPFARQFMWQKTGEELFSSQVKGVTDLLSDLLRPSLRLAPETGIAHADVDPLGINVFLEQEVDREKRELAVQMAASAGYHWLRQEFPWEDIEIHGRGDFEDRRHEPYRSAWEKYDHIVELAEKYDMELIVRISNPPAWSRAFGDEVGAYAPPDDIQDYANFVSAVVNRYRGRIHYYQIWNEPNIYPEWGVYAISPEDYVELLKAGATAARQADPDTVIIAGALAATINLQPQAPPPLNSLSDLVFMQRMYDAGAAPYFDIASVQGYGLWSGPTDRRMHPRVLNISHHLFLRDLMVENGDEHKPIWISEMGWNAAPQGVQASYGRVSQGQQARYLPLAYERVREDWPWIGVANTWYLKRATDVWERNRQPEAYFRLLAPDFTPQPVYESMRAYTESLAQRDE